MQSIEEISSRRADLYRDMRRMEKEDMGASPQWNYANIEWRLLEPIQWLMERHKAQAEHIEHLTGINKLLVRLMDKKEPPPAGEG